MALVTKWLTMQRGDRGQGTVEYFLVILAATALAVVAINWVNSGSGGGILGGLFDNVIDWVTGQF